MITQESEDFNDKSKEFINFYQTPKSMRNNEKSPYQQFYDEQIKKILEHKKDMVCPKCKEKGKLIRYGKYNKPIKTPYGSEKIKIQRFQCNECKCTHALLLSSMIPYSQILLRDMISIVKAKKTSEYNKIMLNNQSIDEPNIRYIKRQFHYHWEEKIHKMNLKLDDISLVYQCFLKYNEQFMQNRNMQNIFFPYTNTS